MSTPPVPVVAPRWLANTIIGTGILFGGLIVVVGAEGLGNFFAAAAL